VARVVDEMQRLQQEQGVDYFRFAGSNPPQEFLVSIARELVRRRVQVNYGAYAALRFCDPEHFSLLRESGLRAVFFGVETGDPGFLRRVHGKNNGGAEHITAVCNAAMSSGIFVALSFIVPSPFETPETKQATLLLIDRIFAQQRRGSVIVLPGMLAPGSRWWVRMAEYGFAFTGGLDRTGYIRQNMDVSYDFLLPKTCWGEFGFTLNGKSFTQLLEESQDFSREVNERGILTDMDDASYMLGMLGCRSPGEHKREMIRALVDGGGKRLSRVVRLMNKCGNGVGGGAGLKRCEAGWAANG